VVGIVSRDAIVHYLEIRTDSRCRYLEKANGSKPVAINNACLKNAHVKMKEDV